MKALKVEIKETDKQDVEQRWYWVLRATNGRILATSEMYSSYQKAKQTALKMVDVVMHEYPAKLVGLK